MKNKINFLKVLFLLMGVFLFFASSCEKDDDTITIPELSTIEVTEVTSTTAISGGNITDEGGETVTARGVCWSTTENPTINDNKTDEGTGAGSFTSSITDLEPNTTYYVRAYATNSAGTDYGRAMAFTTQETLPVLSTEEVTEITGTTAISGGNITDDGGNTVTARGVCWSTAEDPTTNGNKTEDGTGAGSFTSSITGLEPNTTYYVRAYATNSAGTDYGSAISFTTQETLPVLSTEEVTEITGTTAISGGNITDDGGNTVTARGVCWSTAEDPTTNGNKTEDGTGAGSFTSSITDLELNTTYYLRAYATNSVGTAYGSNMSFTTTGSTFTDPRDGKVYQTVTIGKQEWMAENLAYGLSSGNYWAYDNDNSNVETYGYLYDWKTALDVCPAGWHLPSDDEWKELEMALGMSQVDADDTGWRGTNEGSILAGNAGLWPGGALEGDADFGTSGFTALPGGYRYDYGPFDYIGDIGLWWSATENNTNNAWYRQLSYYFSDVSRHNINKGLGISVRCMRD